MHLGYVIEVAKANENFELLTVIDDPKVQVYAVGALNPNTNYSFRVYAASGVGVSDASAAVNITTRASVPSAPANVRVAGITSNTGLCDMRVSLLFIVVIFVTFGLILLNFVLCRI
jgi:hypothetical protein